MLGLNFVKKYKVKITKIKTPKAKPEIFNLKVAAISFAVSLFA